MRKYPVMTAVMVLRTVDDNSCHDDADDDDSLMMMLMVIHSDSLF